MGKTQRRTKKEMSEAQLQRALEQDERTKHKKYRAPAPIQKDHYHETTGGSRAVQDRAAIDESVEATWGRYEEYEGQDEGE